MLKNYCSVAIAIYFSPSETKLPPLVSITHLSRITNTRKNLKFPLQWDHSRSIYKQCSNCLLEYHLQKLNYPHPQTKKLHHCDLLVSSRLSYKQCGIKKFFLDNSHLQKLRYHHYVHHSCVTTVDCGSLFTERWSWSIIKWLSYNLSKYYHLQKLGFHHVCDHVTV